MRNFSEKERCCEAAFQSRQLYCHTYTNGKDMPVLFTDNRDMALAMNIIAQAAFINAGKVTIIAFAVMNNHFHFVLEGDLHPVNEMLSFILKRIRRAFSLEKLPEVSSKPIEDLASMRNHIVYVHRNGYVANLDHTPFSYPWGSGAHYFMPTIHGKPFSEITSTENRAMFRSRDVKLPSDWPVIDADLAASVNAGISGWHGPIAGNSGWHGPIASISGWHGPIARNSGSKTDYSKRNSPDIASEKTPGSTLYVAPPSFCDIALGMAMFRDAHHYFAAVSKNVEAYSGIAVEIDDGEFLTDQELFAQAQKIVREKYRLASTKDLTGAQRLDLARTLHYDYRSSNGQIHRVLGLGRYDIDSIFPRGE